MRQRIRNVMSMLKPQSLRLERQTLHPKPEGLNPEAKASSLHKGPFLDPQDFAAPL